MITEVLPVLDLLLLQDKPLTSVKKFIGVRRDSGRPVTIVNMGSEFERLESYLSEKK